MTEYVVEVHNEMKVKFTNINKVKPFCVEYKIKKINMEKKKQHKHVTGSYSLHN